MHEEQKKTASDLPNEFVQMYDRTDTGNIAQDDKTIGSCGEPYYPAS